MFFEDLITRAAKLVIKSDNDDEKKEAKPPYTSSLGMKYPSLRDTPLKTGEAWLNGKRMDDGAEGLWRIHDQLYDFTDFIKRHPGGEEWLSLTKGTDISEAFEVHHISEIPEHMISKFLIRPAKTPRNYPFTFKEDGFYKTLKRRLRPIIKTLPENPISITKMYTDSLMMLSFLLAILTVRTGSYFIGAIAAVVLGLNAIASHNFFHMKDNFRMYYFDLTTLPSREWRIVHALSHHLHTNTLQDLEISMFEPWAQYLPSPDKTLLGRYFAVLHSPFLYLSIFITTYLKRMLAIILDNKGANRISKTDLIPLCIPTAMYLFSGTYLPNVLFWWGYILIVGSLYYGVIAINSAHHHPEVFHEMDAPRPIEQRDWGISQIDAVVDRKELNNSHFLILTNFGDHLLHHFFPTIDHGQLRYLHPAFNQVCKEFGLQPQEKTPWQMVVGQFKQLLNNTPNVMPPGHKVVNTQ